MAAYPGGQTPSTSQRPTVMQQFVEKIFTYPPIFSFAAKKARQNIIDRGERLGLDFRRDIAELQSSVNWNDAVAEYTNQSITVPEYYKVPFHAYESGNLSIDAALEVTVAAKSVHAAVYDSNTLDPEGDTRLRTEYSRCMTTMLVENHGVSLSEVHDILDIGAATGLSSVALLNAFPGDGIRVVGIDLSPYFVAVGNHLLRDVIETGRLSLQHGAAEAIDCPDASFDLISMCLVCHELPQSATRDIFREAYRVLRPGGALCIMEMDPTTPAFQKILANPIPYVIFKSTEPYLLEYVALDMDKELVESGFGSVSTMSNSPRHKTVVAIKHS